MRSRRKSPPLLEEGEEEPLLNLTPLLDVVFVLLITFLILAPWLHVDSVDLARSGPSAQKSSSQTRSLSIAIHADRSLWVQGKKRSLAELESLLCAAKKASPHEVPQLVPDNRVPFGTYQEVKNLLEACGFEQMEIVLEP